MPLFRTPSRSWAGLFVALLTVALVFMGCDSNGGGGDDDMPDNPTIAERAANQENLSTLAGALQDAGLADTLGSDDATFTVFAPTNSAFENIDADELTGDGDLLSEVLTYHVVPGQAIASGDIQDGQTVETLEGETLEFSVSDGTVQVNGATVTTADVEASNGVVHIVDSVLLETVDAVDRAVLTPQLATTADAIAAAGLDASDSPLRNETLTLFAPTDGAFSGLKLDALTSNTELLARILQYHAVPGSRLTSDQISGGETPGTLEGGNLNIAVDGGTVTVNGIPVSTTDIQTENATIHLIDGVLLDRIDIVERASITEGLETLTSAVQAAGLDASDSPLRNDDPVTVFAPVNSAFDPLDVDELTGDSEILNRVLTHHAVSGQITSDQLSDGQTPTTLEGGSVEIGVSDGTVTVNGIPVSTADIQTRNGVVHVIDGVLLERLDVVQRATVTSNLSTLTTAVGAAGLADALKGDGPFTVFAPVDSAFADYNVEALTGNQNLLSRVLEYHAISGQAITSDQLSSGESPQTLEGGTITIGVNDGVSLNERVTVTTTDIEVRNGVVHLLDDVLLRRTNVVQRALVTPNFSILADLVSQAGLADDLSNEDGTFTVFAPTNDAFLAALDDNDNGEIDDGEVPSNAADLLQYHVANSVFYAADEPTAPSGAMIPEGDTDVSTLEGSNLLVRRDGSSVTLNPENEASSVIAPDVDVTNGVIHGIDTVLSIPSSGN
ncbi:MAG TPA: fasciclin domain-containing protein [Salinibacter sp.]|nr:fasciclin domain-containing protein [Salinibacter sp.]